MAMSMGQEKATSRGISHGPLGHGGHHRLEPVSSSMPSHHMSPDAAPRATQGHTMDHEHGGMMPVGC